MKLWATIYAQADEMHIAQVAASDLMRWCLMDRNSVKRALESDEIEKWVKVTKAPGHSAEYNFARENSMVYNVYFINESFLEHIKTQWTTRLSDNEQDINNSLHMSEKSWTTRRDEDEQVTNNSFFETKKEIDKKTTKQTDSQMLIGFDVQHKSLIINEGEKEGKVPEIPAKPKRKTATKVKKAGEGPSELSFDLKNELLEAYFEFYRSRNGGLNPPMNYAAEVKGLREIVVKLRGLGFKDHQLVDAWKRLLASWDMLDPWIQQQVRIIQINSQLQNIVYQINNPKRTANEQHKQKLAGKIAAAGSRDYSRFVRNDNKDPDAEPGIEKD